MTIQVYMDDGRVFEYDIVDDPGKAREHASAIVTSGYRHNNGKEFFEHYPAHRILKVKVCGFIPTNYPDKTKGT